MKVKLLVFAAALLMLSSLSFGQPFVACIGSADWQMPVAPGSPDFVADGTPIHIYWDANSNGPDVADVLVQVCDLPPDCPTGPAGSYNYNSFPGGVNGESAVGMAGTFVFDPCFVSVGILPTPARYWLKVGSLECPPGYTGTPGYWQSVVMTFIVGPQEYWLQASEWTYVAGECVPVITCQYSGPEVFLVDGLPHPGPRDVTAAVTLCNTNPCALVKVGPLGTQDAGIAAGRLPQVTLTYGGCDPDPAGAGWTFDGGFMGPWTLVYEAGEFYYTQPVCIGSGSEGCASLHLDFVLPVEMGNVAITPSDNAVIVKFNTRSESEVDRFDIRRDGEVIARLDAANSATGHEYSYTDETAVNGTTYTYELVLVNLNGSSSVVKSETVTPSMDKAVVTEYALHQNFPNPFNPTTSVRFDLVEKNFVTLKVYNATGQEVATVVNGERHAGVNVVNFDAANLTSGLYFYTVKVGNVYSATKKMLLVK